MPSVLSGIFISHLTPPVNLSVSESDTDYVVVVPACRSG